MTFYCPRDDCPNSFSSSSSFSTPSTKNSFVVLSCDPCGYALKCSSCSAKLLLCENCLCLMEWDPVLFNGTFSANVCRRCGFLNIFGKVREELSSGLRPIEYISIETLNYINKKANISFEDVSIPSFANIPSILGPSVLSEFGGDEEFSFQSLRFLKSLYGDNEPGDDFLEEVETFLNLRDNIASIKKDYDTIKRALNVTRYIPPTKDSSGKIDATKIIQTSLTTKADAVYSKLVEMVGPFIKYLPKINEKLKELYSTLLTTGTTIFPGREILKYKIFLMRLLFHTISSTVLL